MTGVAAAAARVAAPADAGALASLAAATFPLACPPGTDPEAIAAHIRERLSPAAVTGWLADPAATVVVVDGAVSDRGDARLAGYALAVTGPCSDAEAAMELRRAGLATDRIHELSKIYVRPDAHGGGTASSLMDATLAEVARVHGAGPMWLGTNAANARAQAFYRRHGFEVIGSRTYVVGGQRHSDVVMLRR